MPGVQKLGRGRSRTSVFCLATCAVVGVALVWSRTANMGTSFWSDEAHSAYYYAGRGPHAIFFTTYVPNNHVLYNLLSWVTTGFVGRFEAASRFWSVAPGLAAVVVAAWWAWRRLGAIAATTIVVLATVSPVHQVLTTQARGYGLAMFGGVVMLIGAVRATERESTRDIVVFSVGALIGIWTLPVFAIPAALQAAVLLFDSRIRRRTLIACAGIGVASLVWYAPMLGDIAHNADQEYGARLALVGIVTGAYHHLAAPTIGNALLTDPHSLVNEVATFLVVIVLAVTAAIALWRTGGRALLAHLVAPVFGTYLVLFAGRFYVQSRFTSYLLFHVIILLAVGVQQWWDALRRVTPARAVVAVAIVAVAAAGVSRVANLTEDQARLPWENNRFVADVANATGIRYVFTDTTHPVPFYYYLGRKRVVSMSSYAVKRRDYCKVTNRFIFVDDTYHGAKANLTCLERRHAVKLVVPQQTDPPIRKPGTLTIYIVPGRAAAAKTTALHAAPTSGPPTPVSRSSTARASRPAPG